MRPALIVLALLAGLLTVSACDDMSKQRKAKAYGTSKLFADGKVAQLPPEGTVSRDQLARETALATRPPMSKALIERGQARYDIYCVPCHGRNGDGGGIVPSRGYPHPPDFTAPRLLDASDRHFVDVITQGYGVMYPYAQRVEPADRWAIAAYIRALQAARTQPVTALDAADRARLEREGR